MCNVCKKTSGDGKKTAIPNSLYLRHFMSLSLKLIEAFGIILLVFTTQHFKNSFRLIFNDLYFTVALFMWPIPLTLQAITDY